MVSHRRRRTILTALGLYIFAALFIGYFAVNAFTGNHGLRAQLDLDQQLAAMQRNSRTLKAERALWERRVALLRSDRLDPDMLDERARALLGYVDPRDLTCCSARASQRRRYPPPALAIFQSNFRGVLPQFRAGGLALPPPGDLSYWGVRAQPRTASMRGRFCKSQGVPMAVAQKNPKRRCQRRRPATPVARLQQGAGPFRLPRPC